MNKNMKQACFGLVLAGLVGSMCMMSAEGIKNEEEDALAATSNHKMQSVSLSSSGELESVYTEGLDSKAEVQEEQVRAGGESEMTMSDADRVEEQQDEVSDMAGDIVDEHEVMSDIESQSRLGCGTDDAVKDALAEATNMMQQATMQELRAQMALAQAQRKLDEANKDLIEAGEKSAVGKGQMNAALKCETALKMARLEKKREAANQKNLETKFKNLAIKDRMATASTQAIQQSQLMGRVSDNLERLCAADSISNEFTTTIEQFQQAAATYDFSMTFTATAINPPKTETFKYHVQALKNAVEVYGNEFKRLKPGFAAFAKITADMCVPKKTFQWKSTRLDKQKEFTTYGKNMKTLESNVELLLGNDKNLVKTLESMY